MYGKPLKKLLTGKQTSYIFPILLLKSYKNATFKVLYFPIYPRWIATKPDIYKGECLSVCLSVCLFVLHAFGHGTSKCNETLQGIPFGPGEGQDGVTPRMGGWVKFHPGYDVLQF